MKEQWSSGPPPTPEGGRDGKGTARTRPRTGGYPPRRSPGPGERDDAGGGSGALRGSDDRLRAPPDRTRARQRRRLPGAVARRAGRALGARGGEIRSEMGDRARVTPRLLSLRGAVPLDRLSPLAGVVDPLEAADAALLLLDLPPLVDHLPFLRTDPAGTDRALANDV